MSIYPELSTAEIVTISGKSKPTVLKHLKDLAALDEVTIRTEHVLAAHDRKIYSRKSENVEIRGQDLHEQVRTNPNFVLDYNNYKMSEVLVLKDVVDSMVEYQKRLNKEVEAEIKRSITDPEKVIQLMKDNLGGSSFKYLTQKGLFGEGVDNIREYLEISLTLPIRRIIEQLSKDEWQIDGTLWNYDED